MLAHAVGGVAGLLLCAASQKETAYGTWTSVCDREERANQSRGGLTHAVSLDPGTLRLASQMGNCVLDSVRDERRVTGSCLRADFWVVSFQCGCPWGCDSSCVQQQHGCETVPGLLVCGSIQGQPLCCCVPEPQPWCFPGFSIVYSIVHTNTCFVIMSAFAAFFCP